MATIPPPDSTPETPPMNPGIPDEVTTPSPDVDIPDPNPGDPGDPGNPGLGLLTYPLRWER